MSMDVAVFQTPDIVDLERPNLGARLEAKVAIEELLKRTAHFELAGRVQHVSSVFVRTPAELPIAVHL